MMWCWHLSFLVLATAPAHADDIIADETCLLQQRIQQRRSTTNVSLSAQPFRQDAPYEGNCWDRPSENKEIFIPNNAIEAGMKAVMFMDLAYALANEVNHQDADFAMTETRDLRRKVSNTLEVSRGPGEGAFAITAKLDGMLFVAMRGTADSKDVVADLESATTSQIQLGSKWYSAGKGFVDFYEQIRSSKLGKVFETELKNPGTPVTVVGHSLGGAIANLAAVDFANRYRARVRLVTAGSPRVFDTDTNEGPGTLYNSAKHVQSELIVDGVGVKADQNGYCQQPPTTNGKICTQRWVNFGDGVTGVPPCSPGYVHVGNGGVLINQFVKFGFGSNPVTATPQWQDYTAYNYANFWTNHKVSNYYKRMKYALEGLDTDGEKVGR